MTPAAMDPPFSCRGRIPKFLIDTALIFLGWACLHFSIALGSLICECTSTNIASMGEDFNWLILLQSNTPVATAQQFWKIDSRNPLSPWFYLMAKPLIFGINSGIAWVHSSVALALGMSCYALLHQVVGSNYRWFAVATGIAVAVNVSNAYFDHIIWNFQLALCFSILAIVAYLRFLDTARRNLFWYGVSLSLWTVAFQTYTIQSGAIIAIGLCHFRDWLKKFGTYSDGTREETVSSWIKSAASELLPFAIVFFIFNLVWMTTSSNDAGFTYSFSLSRLTRSIMSGLFHDDIPLMFAIWTISANRIALIVLGCVTAFVISVVLRGTIDAGTTITRQTSVFLVSLIFALAIPTMVLEAGGQGWPPGSRWRMIYQFTTPVLAMCAASFVLSFGFATRRWLPIFYAILLSGWIVFALVYNERQARLMQSEMLVRTHIQEFLDERSRRHFSGAALAILELEDSFRWFANETLREVYMRNWFPNVPIQLRFLPSPNYRSLAREDRLRFSETEVSWIEAGQLISYDFADIAVFRASDRTVRRESVISEGDIRYHNGDWQLEKNSLTVVSGHANE